MAGSALGKAEGVIGPGRQLDAGAGRARVPVARRVLVGATVAGAAAMMLAVGAAVLRARVPVNPAQFLVVAVLMTLCVVARVPVGTDRRLPRLNWSELGLMAAFVLVPVVWVPLAALGGVLLGVARDVAVRSTGRRAGFTVARVALGAAVAVAVAIVLGADLTATVPAGVGHPRGLAVLLVAATANFLVATLLASAWVATDGAGPVLGIWHRFVRAGLPLLVGASLIGIAGVTVLGVNRWWLAVLALMLFVLHRSYLSRTRSLDDRRVLAALADAMPALQEMDERDVRGAALQAAAMLFAPDQVELVLRQESGRDVVVRDPEGPPIAGTVRTRRLIVGGAEIGELRLRFRRPVTLSAAEHDALLTFGDAVASALHDAATHRRLQAMTALSAYEAVHDPLTGLSNRFTLLARGNAELGRLDAGQPVALILFDINQFRDFNEAMSPAAGDEVLRVLARRLSEVRADGELLGSLGGDEFALLISDLGRDDGVERVTERAAAITAALAEPADIGGVSLVTEVSAGVVAETAGGSDMIELLRRADLALRQARREGARVCAYEPSNDPVRSDRLVVLADLRDAFATTDELVLYLQPIVDLRTGLPTGMEALVYWRHPRRGLLGPDQFVDVVEHSDMAAGFTRYTLDLALAVAAAWAEAGLDLPISVNLPSRCTVNPEVLATVAAMLTEHGVPGDRLVIEITEAVMETELAIVDRVIAGLRDLGVRVSISDFGTASASLSFLARIPVDEVKIDRSFVAAMGASPQTDAIVRTTVDLAAQLGLRVVAEGVERLEQRQALERLGVTAAQGPLLHPPLAAERATELVQALAPAL